MALIPPKPVAKEVLMRGKKRRGGIDAIEAIDAKGGIDAIDAIEAIGAIGAIDAIEAIDAIVSIDAIGAIPLSFPRTAAP